MTQRSLSTIRFLARYEPWRLTDADYAAIADADRAARQAAMAQPGDKAQWFPDPHIIRTAIGWGLFTAVAVWGVLGLLLSPGGM